MTWAAAGSAVPQVAPARADSQQVEGPRWYCEEPPQRTAQVSSHWSRAISLDMNVPSRQLLVAARRLRKVQRGIPIRDFTDGGKALLRLLQDEGQEATKRARQR